jgi:polysaccharide export outer membrane protein
MWKRIQAGTLFVLLISSVHSARAQKPETDYVLSPGDVIEVSVLNHNDLDKTLTVLPDGKIAFAAVGEMKAAGKTPKALAAELHRLLDKTLNNFGVTVTVKELHARKVRVIGAVKTPGSYDFKDDQRFLDVVAAAGGLSNKPARVTGRIIRGGLKVVTLDVEGAIARPETTANIVLELDDLILLDETEAPAKPQVFAMGQVSKPGAFDLDNSTSILSLLAQAGNATEKAAFSKAYILRGGKELPLNLRPLVVEGKSDPLVSGFKLESGDVLFLPENEARIAVMGQALKPGYYLIPEKGQMMVLDAINLAGIQPQGADTAKAGIIRMKGGKPVLLPLNLDKMLKKGDLSANIPLQTEDILFIPQKGSHGLGLQDIYGPLSALSILGLRVFR